MTYLELVNDVLVRLRETAVSTVSETSYSSLIGKFVNDAKRQIEDAYAWNVLGTTITLSTTAGGAGVVTTAGTPTGLTYTLSTTINTSGTQSGTHKISQRGVLVSQLNGASSVPESQIAFEEVALLPHVPELQGPAPQPTSGTAKAGPVLTWYTA